jgi:hypothetical protein
MSHDDSKVLINCSSHGGSASLAVSFLGGPNVVWDLRQSWLVAVDSVTGAEIWKARNQFSAAQGSAKSLKTHQYSTGPEAEKILAVTAFLSSLTVDHGARDSGTDVLAYNAKTFWPALINGGNDMTLHMIARDDDGKVIPAECFPIMSATSTETTTGVVVDFRIS